MQQKSLQLFVGRGVVFIYEITWFQLDRFKSISTGFCWLLVMEY